MDSSKVNVWVVEDDDDLREAYAAFIDNSDAFKVTGNFRTAEEALRHLKGELPEIILMDVELPGKSGIQCTSLIKDKFPAIKIIMVTVYEDNEIVFEALKAGASGYITKKSNYTQLISGLQEIVDGGAPMSGRIAKMVIENFHTNPNSPLTKREKEVLQMVASGKTFTQISEELFIGRETTKTHVRNIYQKLQVNCRAEAIARANKEHLI